MLLQLSTTQLGKSHEKLPDPRGQRSHLQYYAQSLLNRVWNRLRHVLNEKRTVFSLALCFVLHYFPVPFSGFCFCTNAGISTSFYFHFLFSRKCVCVSVNCTYILALLFSEEDVKCGRTVRKKSVKFAHPRKMLEKQTKQKSKASSLGNTDYKKKRRMVENESSSL